MKTIDEFGMIIRVRGIIHWHLHKTGEQDGCCADAAADVVAMVDEEFTTLQRALRSLVAAGEANLPGKQPGADQWLQLRDALRDARDALREGRT